MTMIKQMLSQGIAKQSITQLMQLSIADTQMQQVTTMNWDYPAAYCWNTFYSVYVISWLCQYLWEILLLATTTSLFWFYILAEF